VATVRTFLLDDYELVRRGLRGVLADEPDIEIVGEAATVRDGRDQILAVRPDVAVVDGRLFDGSGIDVCRDVRAADPTIRVIILTSYEDDEAMFSAILAGASGYVLKNIRGLDLVGAIRRVAAGETLLDPAMTSRVLDRILGAERGPPEIRNLSAREREILAEIADGRTNREIAERLGLSQSTVKTYVSRLFDKLDVRRRAQAAVLAAKLLRHEDEPPP
jgi:two-component system, NarL family, response regulator DevR